MVRGIWFLTLLALSSTFFIGCSGTPFSKVSGSSDLPLPKELERFEVKDTPLPAPSTSPEPEKARKKRRGKKAPAPLVYPSWRPAIDPLYVGENAVYEIGWGPLSAGDVIIDVLPYNEINGRKVYHLRWQIVSSSGLNLIYRINDTMESHVDFAGLFSLRFHQLLDESKQSKDALEIHDEEKGQTFFWNRHSRAEGYIEQKEYRNTPRFAQDWVSALYFLRFKAAEPMPKSFQFPIIFEGKPWEGHIRVDGHEEIGTLFGDRMATVMTFEPWAEGRSFGTGRIWVSDDDRRIVFKMEIKTKVGPVVVRLRKYQAGEPSP